MSDFENLKYQKQLLPLIPFKKYHQKRALEPLKK